MPKKELKVGDRVVVTSVPPFKLPRGVKDEIGIAKPLKHMVGRVYTIRPFDDYGNVELWPKRLDSVWVEPEFLKLRAKRKPSTPRRRNYSSPAN